MGLCVTRICGPRRVATRVAYPKRMVSDKKTFRIPAESFSSDNNFRYELAVFPTKGSFVEGEMYFRFLRLTKGSGKMA